MHEKPPRREFRAAGQRLAGRGRARRRGYRLSAGALAADLVERAVALAEHGLGGREIRGAASRSVPGSSRVTADPAAAQEHRAAGRASQGNDQWREFLHTGRHERHHRRAGRRLPQPRSLPIWRSVAVHRSTPCHAIPLLSRLLDIATVHLYGGTTTCARSGQKRPSARRVKLPSMPQGERDSYLTLPGGPSGHHAVAFLPLRVSNEWTAEQADAIPAEVGVA